MRWYRGKGCLLPGWVFLFVLVLLLVGAFLLGRHYLAAAPRVDTTSFITQQTAAIARVDFSAPGIMTELLPQVPILPRILLQLALPYECSLHVEVDADRKVRQLVGAMSMRRFGRHVLSMFDKVESLPSLGQFRWTTPGIVSEQGALLLRGEEGIGEEAAMVAQERWKASPAETIRLDGTHFLEVFVDNRRGQGFLAFAELSTPPETPGGAASGDSSKAASPPKQELQQIFDARELSGLFYRARTAHFTADAQGANGFRIGLTIECPDEMAARSVEFALMTVRDLLFRNLLEAGLTLEGDPIIEGPKVRADFTLTGVENALHDAIRGLYTQNPKTPQARPEQNGVKGGRA